MAPQNSFHYETEFSEIDPSQDLDSRGTKVTTIRCHGRILAENCGQIQAIFTDIPFKGRIVIDLSDVEHLDSAGLGALMRLKLSALKHGGVSVKFVQMTPRVMQILSIANLTDWFSS